MDTTQLAPEVTPRRGRGPWFGAGLTAAVVALVAGGLVVGFGAAGLTPVLSWRNAHDPGVQACADMRAARESGLSLDDVSAGARLAASREPHLRRAGTALAAYYATPEDQRLSKLGDIVGVMGDIGAGCTAVGVTLPADFFAAS